MGKLNPREMLRQMLTGPARMLDLDNRVPRYFSERGWDMSEDLIGLAIISLSACALHAGKTPVSFPSKAAFANEWKGLLISLERPSCQDVVDHLQLGQFLELPPDEPKATPEEVAEVKKALSSGPRPRRKRRQ